MTSLARTGEGHYRGFAGEIHYRWWAAPDPTWVVLLAHGFGDHTASWARYAGRLVDAGGAVVACDHRGHGLSDGPRAVIEDFDVVAREYLGALDAAPLPANAPVVLAGHSMGGLIAARAATLRPEAACGVVLSATHLGAWPAAANVLSAITSGEPIPAEARGHILLDPDATFDPTTLSRDRTFTDKVESDELRYIGQFPVETLRAWLAVGQRCDALPDGALELPTLYLHGSADPMLSHRISVATLARIAQADLEVRIFPGARHSIYNETNRDEVFGVLTGFLSRVSHGYPGS